MLLFGFCRAFEEICIIPGFIDVNPFVAALPHQMKIFLKTPINTGAFV